MYIKYLSFRIAALGKKHVVTPEIAGKVKADAHATEKKSQVIRNVYECNKIK